MEYKEVPINKYHKIPTTLTEPLIIPNVPLDLSMGSCPKYALVLLEVLDIANEDRASAENLSGQLIAAD